jgi:hypothetical protein
VIDSINFMVLTRHLKLLVAFLPPARTTCFLATRQSDLPVSSVLLYRKTAPASWSY